MRRWQALALVAWFGCAPTWAPVGPMLLEGRDNDLAATSKYRSKELRLTGVVVSTGQKKIEHGSGRTEDRWVESPAMEADVPYPFVQLRDAEHPSQDVLVCYFTDGELQATKLTPGATARVRGFFLQYSVTGGHMEAVLNHCSLDP